MQKKKRTKRNLCVVVSRHGLRCRDRRLVFAGCDGRAAARAAFRRRRQFAVSHAPTLKLAHPKVDVSDFRRPTADEY